MSRKVPIFIGKKETGSKSIKTSKAGVRIGSSLGSGDAHRLAVTPAGYDNVGQILTKMGMEFQTMRDSALSTSDLSKIDVLFLNCSGSCHTYAATADQVLRQYVAEGGSIYSSDFAASYIQKAFPEHFQYRGDGHVGHLTADVVDKGLQQVLGNRVKLTFDMPDWRVITYLSSRHRKYLVSDGKPLLVSFPHGKGQVFYTSFHSHAQPTSQEEALLNFLILKPLAMNTAPRFELLSEAGRRSLQDIPLLASPGLTKTFNYQNSRTQTLLFVINWAGQAEFGFSVYHPSGQKFSSVRCTDAPGVIRCPDAEPGDWKYTIECLKIPHANFHYTATVGTDEVMLALPSPNKR